MYITWVNSGLDDKILKSIQSTNKTEKTILVHDTKRGDYYRRQLVNTDINKFLRQPNQSNKSPIEQSNKPSIEQPTKSSDNNSKNQQLFEASKKLGIIAKDIKTAKFIQQCITKPTEKTKSIIQSKINRHQLVATNSGVKCSLSDVSKSTFLKISKLIEDSYIPISKGDKFSKHYKINGIYKVTNLAEEADFERLKQQNASYKTQSVLGKNCQSDLFFHGTTYPALLNLLGQTGGFTPAASVGEGTNTTTDTRYALNYAIGRYDSRDNNGVLILSEGSIGQYTQDYVSPNKNNPKDTIAADTGMIKYFVFRKEHSLIPRYIIDITQYASNQPSKNRHSNDRRSLTKSSNITKVYKEIYIPPDGKHKGFYRKYLINPERAETGSKISKLYKLYLNFIKLLEDHDIIEGAQDKLSQYKTKLIRSVTLAKNQPLPMPVFAFSDYTDRRLQEAEVITKSKWMKRPDPKNPNKDKLYLLKYRTLQYPGEKDNPEFDLEPKDEVVDFINKNLVLPLRAAKGKIKDCRGINLEVYSTNERHFYQRAELRISQYVEQYVTEKHYHDLRMTLGYDIRDPATPPEIKMQFETFRDVFEQHIRHDIDANADTMAKELCDGIIDTLTNPLWKKEGHNKENQNSIKNGITEFHSKKFTVIVAHNGTLITFWPKSAGERFAIEQGWRGATKKSSPLKSRLESQWMPSKKTHQDFLKNFDKRNFAIGYYPQQPSLKDMIFKAIRYSNNIVNYPDNYFIKRFQYEQYNLKQLLEIAQHHGIQISKQPEGMSKSKYQNQVINELINNKPGNICLDMNGEYEITSMMKYDSTLFTDYDFSDPVIQSSQDSTKP